MNDPGPQKRNSNAADSGAREALIHAAIERIGHDGFDAVSIRAIADRAGVNAALISYYFGGKEGLYGAAVQHIADQIAARQVPVVEAIEQQLAAGNDSREACFEALCRVADGFLTMLTSPESAPWARIILREQQDPTPHFETLYEGPMGRVMRLCVLLHARIQGREEPTIDDRLGTATIMAQVAFWRSNHAAALRLLGWESVGPDEREIIRDRLHDNFARILGVPR
ncbi:MAG: CerR family C-terminal domain-containing protein [Pseudomonadota bacterium]